MALIQKIRSKSGLVLTLMILAIVSFIAMLIMQDSNPGGGSNRFSNTSTVAKVAGQELDYTKLQETAETMYGSRGSDNQVRNMLFSQFVDAALTAQEADKMGLGISKDELLDLEFGPNPSQVITSNQELMQNPEQLPQIKKAIQENTMPQKGKLYWAEIEKQIVNQRLQAKMNNLVTKAIYTPTWLVEEGYKELTQPVDFEYVRVPFDRIDDKDAPVTDADYAAYLSENASRFTSDEESRTIEYVNIDVIPTVEDSMVLYKKIASLDSAFRTTTNDSSFTIANGGGMNPQYLTSETAGPNLKTLFSASVGTVMGPYVENKSYWLAKLVEKRSAPDSVNSRHILIKPTQQNPNAQATADSLKKILEASAGAWDSLNMKFSTDDISKMKGGVLGFQGQGQLVTEFNDLIFYKAQQGKFYTVASQFGVHIVQVMGVKTGKNETRIKVALIREQIIPSNATDKKASSLADDLLTSSKNLEDLRKNAQAKGIATIPTPGFKINDPSAGQLGGSDGVRQIIRWAYESKAGERCKSTFALRDQGEAYNSKYVVAAVKSIIPKGVPSVADVKEQITPMVKNRKKGEVLKAKFGASDMNAIVSQFNARIDTAKGVTFNATFVPNLGSESKVIGSVFTLENGQVSKPIVGETGVFLAKVTNKTAVANSPVDKNILRQQLVGQMKGMVRNAITKSLKKNGNVTDNRYKFF
jgi:peptidyl-prolyl cis-trans isomerase D